MNWYMFFVYGIFLKTMEAYHHHHHHNFHHYHHRPYSYYSDDSSEENSKSFEYSDYSSKEDFSHEFHNHDHSKKPETKPKIDQTQIDEIRSVTTLRKFNLTENNDAGQKDLNTNKDKTINLPSGISTDKVGVEEAIAKSDVNTKLIKDDTSNPPPTATDDQKQDDIITERVNTIASINYEVTENVLDVPNNDTVLAMIFTNFTIPVPLNNATVQLETSTDNVTDVNKLKTNYISILHIKAEYDEKPANTVQNINLKPHLIPYIKDYIYGLKKGIANGINVLINKDVYNNVNNEITVPNIVAAPIIFLGKLHKKGVAVANKVHHLIRHKYTK